MPAALAAPVDSIGTHHATPSVETLELVIGLATSRVFCRLPPGSVQPAAAPGAAGWTPLDKQPAVAELPVLPQPPTARPAATTRVTLAIAGRLTEHLIRLISRVVGPQCLPYAPRCGSCQEKWISVC